MIMKEYISEGRAIYEDRNCGLFSRKLAEWAISRMSRRNPNTGEMEPLEAYPLEKVEEVMRMNDIRMPDKFIYTVWYLFNMAAADYQKTCRTDEDRIMFAKETLCDPDGCPENVLDCFETKMRNAGVPIFWERML